MTPNLYDLNSAAGVRQIVAALDSRPPDHVIPSVAEESKNPELDSRASL